MVEGDPDSHVMADARQAVSSDPRTAAAPMHHEGDPTGREHEQVPRAATVGDGAPQPRVAVEAPGANATRQVRAVAETACPHANRTPEARNPARMDGAQM